MNLPKPSSHLMSLADIIAGDVGDPELAAPLAGPCRFEIPIYQRPYVWQHDQIRQFCTDLRNAVEDGRDIYFIGPVMLVRTEPADDGSPPCISYEVVDGQQRMTTLWLIAATLRDEQSDLKEFLGFRANDQPFTRLHFAIRDEINDYLQRTLSRGEEQTTEEVSENIRRLEGARDVIRKVFGEENTANKMGTATACKKSITEFIYRHTMFLLTVMPHDSDHNRLFELLNNRGVQLQHHELLKARLLGRLGEDEERSAYARLWDACADMDDYIETSLRKVSGRTASDAAGLVDHGKIACGASVLDFLHAETGAPDQGKILSMREILEQAKGSIPDIAAGAQKEDENADDENDSAVRSIIGFPLFLEHVLRIWLALEGKKDLPRLRDGELLALFEKSGLLNASSAKVKEFLRLVARIRVLFDWYVVKWVEVGDERLLQLLPVAINRSSGPSYLQRNKQRENDQPLAMLQAMLYHSQEMTTQYWLTPFLFQLHRHIDQVDKNTDHKAEDDSKDGFAIAFEVLRHIDNHMLGTTGSTQPNKETLVEASRRFMVYPDPMPANSPIYAELLNWDLGTGFPHYWFYKLEFVLWYLSYKNGHQERPNWRKFQITAKNSIEHVSPEKRRPEDPVQLSKSRLDRFGNLALVSSSYNSEKSNKTYKIKKTEFKQSTAKNLSPSCLKLDMLFDYESWCDNHVQKHQEDMLEKLDQYYENSGR